MFKTSRRSLLSLIAGLPIFRGALASPPDTFSLVPTDVVGRVFRYRQELRHVRNGALGHHSRAIVSLEVLARDDEGWLARWTTRESEVVDADPRVRPMLEVIQAMWDDVPVDLRLAPGGQVLGLADMPAMSARAAASLDRMIASISADPARAAAAEQMRAAMQPVLANEAYLAGTLTKEAAILLGAMSREFRVGEPLEVRSQVPSPLGDGQIAMLGRFSVRGIDERRGQADIGWLMVVDPGGLSQSVGAGVQALADRMGAETAVADMSLDLADRADFLIDTATAWPIRVRHERRVSSAAFGREDTLVLTRLDG
jgi:hypothetical protein